MYLLSNLEMVFSAYIELACTQTDITLNILMSQFSELTQYKWYKASRQGCVAQLVMCLTADPGVTSLILAQSFTFVKIDREIISTAILLPSPDSRRVAVIYKRRYVHKVLVNCLVKLAKESVRLQELTVSHMTIAVDRDVKHQTKQTYK